MPVLDHLVHVCLGEQHLVKKEELPVVDTKSSRTGWLRLPFGAGFLMGSQIL